LCLVQTLPGGNPARATCTAQCATDADCQSATTGNSSDGLCDTSFVCAVATVTGAFKCKTICVCKSDLVCGVNGDGHGGVITPSECPNPSPAPSCGLMPSVPPLARLASF
jgi:hypothetical protein